MTDAWRVFNNMLVSLGPLLSGLIGIALLGMALAALFYAIRRASS